MKSIHRITAAALILALLLTGCGAPAQPTTAAPTDPTTIETIQATQQTTVPTVPTEPMPDPSLNGLRQALVGTTQVFAVAYFGYHETLDSDAPVDPYVAMQENAPQLCTDLPFLLDIPKERVAGKTGDLFCIVPGSVDATVTVARGIWDDAAGENRYEDVIYTGSGEPILLLCNNSGWEPDTRVTVSGPDGEAVWYPMVDDNHCPDELLNENGEDLFYDFTPYRDMLITRYNGMKGEWVLPGEEVLVGTTWLWTGWRKDGLETSYLVTFREDTLYIRWNDGYSRMDYEYHDAPWQLTYEGDYAVLSIDLGEFGGVLRYNLLYHEDYAELYVGQDVIWGPGNIGFEPTYRYLVPAGMPETLELEGSWELMWTEVEGDKQEAESGQDRFNIYMTDSGLYHCDHVDNVNPRHSFEDKELVIFPFEMYEGCENQMWVAAVNYMPNGTGYDMTLIYGDILQVLVTWLEDDYVGSARYYYRRSYE